MRAFLALRQRSARWYQKCDRPRGVNLRVGNCLETIRAYTLLMVTRLFKQTTIAGALIALMACESLAQEPVDVEIILAVDVSLSMSPDELEIQRRGYAEALQHEAVIQAIMDGVHGRIALAY